MDVCFWLDIAINFRTAYYAGEFGDELVSEWRKIARRYACSWLALDVFASFPFELFSTLFCTSLRSTTCRAREVLKMNRVLRLNRLVKTIEIKAAASRTTGSPRSP